MLASRYNPVTSPVPSPNANGKLRRGSLTSPAVKVMLFHASEENSEPVCATHRPTNNPNAVAALRPVTTST